MINKDGVRANPAYMYRFTCHEQERALCSMEIRQLLQQEPSWQQASAVVESMLDIAVERSPYLKYRLQIWLRAASFEQLLQQAADLQLDQSYKVVATEVVAGGKPGKLAYAERRRIEQALGIAIGGKVDLAAPELLLGVMQWEGEWRLGRYELNEADWQRHDRKPRHYSTALGTRVARAIVNIAVPRPDASITLLDPCCGIGTVLMEAVSQGIAARGYDMNPLAVVGARENMAAFNYNCEISIADMRTLQGSYEAAVLDLPYNHCSVLPAEERWQMLSALKALCKRAVIVSVEPIGEELRQLGAHIIDVGQVAKTHFKRDIWLVSFTE